MYIARKSIQKITLESSYNKCISIEIAKFESSNIYQVFSHGFAGEMLTKNKKNAFMRFIELKNLVIRLNQRAKIRKSGKH